MPDDAQKLLTPIEFAEHAGISITTVYSLCRTRKIPAIKLGHQWRIPADLFEVGAA